MECRIKDSEILTQGHAFYPLDPTVERDWVVMCDLDKLEILMLAGGINPHAPWAHKYDSLTASTLFRQLRPWTPSYIRVWIPDLILRLRKRWLPRPWDSP